MIVIIFVERGVPFQNVASVGVSRCPHELLCVVFLDVGQGDAIFIQSPEGIQMLIDGGRGSEVLRELADVMGFFDHTLDYVMVTHPDADHIGGLIGVLERYEIDKILHTENKSDTSVSRTLAEHIKSEGAEVTNVRRGYTYDLDEGVTLTILYPDRNAEDMESNTSSIVARLTYGESEFLFTGDAPKNVEAYLLEEGNESLQSDVLKVGHHGSKTSSADIFIETVSPTYAIISAGKDNRYGHPHQEVIDRLDSAGVEIKNTAEMGSIFMISDGKNIWFR